MPKVGVDLTAVNLMAIGTYTCQVQKLEYQISTGIKDDGSGKSSWKKDTTQVVDFAAWNSVEDSKRRLHYTVSVPNKGNIFADFYMMENCRGFLQGFMKACGVTYDKDGFDPEEALGKPVTCEVGQEDDPTYGPSNTYVWSKA